MSDPLSDYFDASTKLLEATNRLEPVLVGAYSSRRVRDASAAAQVELIETMRAVTRQMTHILTQIELLPQRCPGEDWRTVAITQTTMVMSVMDAMSGVLQRGQAALAQIRREGGGDNNGAFGPQEKNSGACL